MIASQCSGSKLIQPGTRVISGGLVFMARPMLLLGLFALAGCHSGTQRGDSSQPTPSGRDGLTLEHAILMRGGNEVTNIKEEYAWIREHAPDAALSGQALIGHGNRMYDKLIVLLPDGSSRSYYFDITSGFGKFL